MKKKGKGLSFDQKRERMLSIFHKTKDVFNFQQVEKLSMKAGIPFPNVKEILESLKADSLVECEKIGAGVFYWSFPSRAYQTMTDRLEITRKQMEAFRWQIAELERQIEEGKVGRELTDKRQEAKQQLQQLRSEKCILEKQIEKYIRFDPERYQTLLKHNKELKDALNAEVDNLEQIKKYIKKNEIGIKQDEIEQKYGIPANMQYFQ